MPRILCWNINSVRLRIELLKKLCREYQPDVIALQETKTIDELFPENELKNLGYKYNLFRGEKGYNGVALLSKIEFTNALKLEIFNTDTRHVAFEVFGVEIHNFYVPAGGDIPDENENPKFYHKLRFVEEMHQWFYENRNPTKPMILMGDLNIAPYENDVWSHKQLLNVVSHTPMEVNKLLELYRFGWVDVARKYVDFDQKLYTWWSYRNRDWKKSNRGRRLDHIWVTPALVTQVNNFMILKEARDWQGPSDHVPLILDFLV